MSLLTENEIIENWEKMINYAKKYIKGERLDNVLKLFEYFEDRMSIAPASAKEYYHNAFPGGYVAHINHVTDLALKIKNMWETEGARINFTDEELVFSALFHDLGKVGDLNDDYYVPNDSQWHREHQGKIYSFNKLANFMLVADRTFYLLNQFLIKYSINEFLGIKLAGGLYDSENQRYLVCYSDELQPKTNIGYILHHADMTATRIEYDKWKYSNKNEEKEDDTSNVKQKKTLGDISAPKLDENFFKELFDDIEGANKNDK